MGRKGLNQKPHLFIILSHTGGYLVVGEGHAVHFWCDNLAVVDIFNSLSSMSLRVRKLFWAFILHCLHFNILFVSRHVPRLENGVADALSCKQMWRFH